MLLLNPPLTVPLLLPSNILYHGSPWESLIRRGGHCACDQSGQLLGSLRNKYVLNAHRENNPCKRNRSHTVHDTCFSFFSRKGIGVNTEASPTWKWYIFFFLQNEKLFWQSWLERCLLSCTKDSQKSKVCLPNRSVILKSNTKWCPDISEFFLWKEASHKWLPCYSPQLWRRSLRPAIDGQSYGRMKKEASGKCEL